jgi:hypothetical protein
VRFSGAGNTETVTRRRRTRRHRRNRFLRRVALFVVLAGLTFALTSVALQYLSPSLMNRASKSAAPDETRAEANANLLAITQQEASRTVEDRPVYPYSVVPGGIKDARELKWVAEHDPVIASHYAGFDYEHAQLVRLVLARTAYVSYRIGNHVYWTRRRITLKKGETVITDGKITARTRCGNRVEEMPQQATSSSEPPAAKFEEPVQPAGTAIANPPVPFLSTLANRAPVSSLGPAPLLSLYDPFGRGTWIPIEPPPLPGVCGPTKKSGGSVEMVVASGKKKKGGPCGGGGRGEVPEPGTWLLVASGLGAIYWMGRRHLAKPVLARS